MTDLRARAQALAVAANVVSQLFLAEPTRELLALLGEGEGWPIPDAAADDALARAAAWLRGRPGDADLARELRQDHFELFVGPGRGYACPYESVWLSAENMMFDVETYEVRDAFARLGLAAPAQEKEPDDHIGLEFAFVSEIAERLAVWPDEEVEALRALLAEFCAGHLSRFADKVFAGIREHATTGVYAALPALAESVLAEATALAGV